MSSALFRNSKVSVRAGKGLELEAAFRAGKGLGLEDFVISVTKDSKPFPPIVKEFGEVYNRYRAVLGKLDNKQKELIKAKAQELWEFAWILPVPFDRFLSFSPI